MVCGITDSNHNHCIIIHTTGLKLDRVFEKRNQHSATKCRTTEIHTVEASHCLFTCKEVLSKYV